MADGVPGIRCAPSGLQRKGGLRLACAVLEPRPRRCRTRECPCENFSTVRCTHAACVSRALHLQHGCPPASPRSRRLQRRRRKCRLSRCRRHPHRGRCPTSIYRVTRRHSRKAFAMAATVFAAVTGATRTALTRTTITPLAGRTVSASAGARANRLCLGCAFVPTRTRSAFVPVRTRSAFVPMRTRFAFALMRTNCAFV